MRHEAKKGKEGSTSAWRRSRITSTNISVKLINVCQSRGDSASKASGEEAPGRGGGDLHGGIIRSLVVAEFKGSYSASSGVKGKLFFR